jgi:type III pantothenate kinase
MSLPILDLDVGNSRIKWRFGTGANVRRGMLLRVEGWLDPNWNARMKPRRIRISSVAGRVANAELIRALEARFDVPVEFARTTRRVGHVICGYRDPTKMGVDRWLAILAGWRMVSGSFIVVDLGTAATLDFVDGAGRHRGGYIVPGIMSTIRALGADTARVQITAGPGTGALSPGGSTIECVQRGAERMLVDFVEQSVARFRRSGQHCSSLLVTGGDAAAVSAHLNPPFRLVPELVLDGLAVALP